MAKPKLQDLPQDDQTDEGQTTGETPDTAETDAPISYGEYSIVPTGLPIPSLRALLRRGLAHVIGNEAASKGQTAAEKAIKDKMVADGIKEPKAEDIKATYKSADDDFKAPFKKAAADELFASILDGTLGSNARGSSDPLEVAIRSIAKAEVLVALKANNVKVPKKDEKVKFADGRELSMDDMIEGRLARNGDAIRAEAEKKVAADKAKAEAAKASAKARAEAGPVAAADLGF